MAGGKRRYKGKIMLALLVLISLGSAAAYHFKGADIKEWVLDSSREAGMVLARIDITGNEKTSRKEVEQVLAVEEGMPLLSIDLEALRASVEKLPWVKSVVLRRAYPDRLVIQITEREARALWQTGGRVALIDASGHILTRNNLHDYSDYLLLVGETAHTYVNEITVILNSQPKLKPHVKSAVRVGDRRWDLNFSNGLKVRLPEMLDQETALAAFERFAGLEKQYGLLAREIAVVDMRGDRVVIQLTPNGQKIMKLQQLK